MQEDKAKFKERKLTENGCLRAFVLVLAFPILCWTSLWLFAHFGGEWASSLSIPVPPDSRMLNISYEQDYLYVVKTTVYANIATPEELRDWFVQAGMPMTPVPLDMENTRFIDYEAYYGFTPASAFMSPIQENHYFVSTLTHGWWSDVMPTCQDIRVYKEASFASADYPDLDFSNRATIFVIISCWAAN